MSELPAWVVEGVHLSAYDPAWPARAGQYADELRPVLGPWLLGPIEHVGSTSVPGLVAKPVIDLMAPVEDLDAVAAATIGPLGDRGWPHVPPQFDQRPFRRFFAKVSADGQHRLAHLHVMTPDAARWDQQLRFRDALRADPELRDQYAAVKSRLAAAHAGDRERYTDEKAAFVTRILRDLSKRRSPG
ncbi:MAG: GrpB family protein [Actinobacteria bacterium]|nr:GrpB family protein [Actinomycetota bacterium]